MGAVGLLACVACGGDDKSDNKGSGAAGGSGGSGGSAGAGGSGGSGGSDDSLPTSLPFDFTRPEAGTAPTSSEVSDFTSKITGFWRDIEYFRWQTWHAHGLHESHDPSMPDYALWWQDTDAVKEGDTITFRHRGGADNIMIRTPKVLSQAISGYLATQDPILKQLVIGYSKGIVALFLGMKWGNEEPDEYITARAIFTHNHEYTVDGRKVKVDYDPMYGAACTAHDECPGMAENHAACPIEAETGVAVGDPAGHCCQYGVCTIWNWNSHTVPNQSNPIYGSIWVRNMRSQDDVPHMYRIAPLLMRAAQDAPDEDVREATAEAAKYLRGFAKDVLDHGYQIRTKQDGVAFVPLESNGQNAKDLASFVRFEAVAPNGQCNAKLATALLAGGTTEGNECESGLSGAYESIATITNYFNYAIIRYFHIAAVHNSITFRQNDAATALMQGLADRFDAALADNANRAAHDEWDADLAATLLAAAAAGLPLTAAEAKLVQDEYSAAVDHYAPWDKWDPWAASVPDGTFDYKPSRNGPSRTYVRPEELGFLMHYCYSPYKNPASVEVVDCDRILDRSKWGG